MINSFVLTSLENANAIDAFYEKELKLGKNVLKIEKFDYCLILYFANHLGKLNFLFSDAIVIGQPEEGFSQYICNDKYLLINFIKEGHIEIIKDTSGFMPLYFGYFNNTLWISSEVKLLIQFDEINLSLKPLQLFNSLSYNRDEFSLFENLYKLSPSHILILKKNKIFLEQRKEIYKDLNLEDNFAIFQGFLHNILKQNLKDLNLKDSVVGVPLSGGVDSSTISALAKAQDIDIHTISMGTQQNNEFKYARVVAEYIGSTHHELELTNEEILDGLLKAIYFNEIFDGYSAEIHAPLYSIYSYASSIGIEKVITGYGADLMFGGIIDEKSNIDDINGFLWRQIYRTRWTNELSPFLAQSCNLDVYHPFMFKNLIELALNIPSNYKLMNGSNKYILRDIAIKYYLPKEIAWRKKIGIHQGSSIDMIFSEVIKAKVNDFYTKDKFSYLVYKELFQNKNELKQIDINKILYDSSNF